MLGGSLCTFVGALSLAHLCRFFGTLAALSMPHAAKLFAIGIRLTCRHVSRESVCGHGNRNGQSDRRYQVFHCLTPYWVQHSPLVHEAYSLFGPIKRRDPRTVSSDAGASRWRRWRNTLQGEQPS